MCCNMLQCELQCVAVCCSTCESGKSTVRAGEEFVLQHVAVCLLQSVAVGVGQERAL